MSESTPPGDDGPTRGTTPAGTVACRECGARFDDGLTDCPDCGAPRADTGPTDEAAGAARGLTDQYSPVVWVLSLVVAFLTFPFGLAVPLYFLYKAWGDEPVEQSRLEIAAVLLLGAVLIGIVVVEWKGNRGARFLLGFVAAMTAMGVILLVVFLLGAAA